MLLSFQDELSICKSILFIIGTILMLILIISFKKILKEFEEEKVSKYHVLLLKMILIFDISDFLIRIYILIHFKEYTSQLFMDPLIILLFTMILIKINTWSNQENNQ